MGKRIGISLCWIIGLPLGLYLVSLLGIFVEPSITKIRGGRVLAAAFGLFIIFDICVIIAMIFYILNEWITWLKTGE